MRIVHTSDWHVGRRWKGIQRLDELEAVLEQLADFIEETSVDLVLHTGDIFDSRMPPAEAERLVNEFFVRVGKSGAKMLVIAGNHDDPDRLDARSLLAEYANVQIIGRPRAAKQGTRTVQVRSGELAVVAALPFAPAGKWVSALELAEDEAASRSRYAHMFQLAVQNLCGPFKANSVNLLMAHTHLEGAAFGDSERRVHISEDWAATPQTLPTSASYIALGHIHKPQKLAGVLPAYYAGSPLQMDFGETGEKKTFVVVTAAPGKPARIEHVPYEGGHELVDISATLDELQRMADKYRSGCWLRVTVPLKEKDPDINRRVRDLLPNALVVRAELPETIPLPTRPPSGDPAEQYKSYYEREYERVPETELVETFKRLHSVASGGEE